jgi:hypothetical protein
MAVADARWIGTEQRKQPSIAFLTFARNIEVAATSEGLYLAITRQPAHSGRLVAGDTGRGLVFGVAVFGVFEAD